MPRYAPLPAVNIDPRNESQLVNEAAKRVYDASNAKLNDFSAGNPMMALIEGQAFAQSEFLFWANQLPESILIEWIGPFLGAMRRLGTPATTRLTIAIAPQQFQTSILAGTEFTTDPNLTGGESVTFVTTQDLVYPPGESVGMVPASSVLIGTFNNVAPNTITQSSGLDIQVTAVTNEIAAVGGSDVETLDVVKERFFTLIRRRNPVSAQDWQDLFDDLFGAGTFTAVLPNRSAQESYIWLNDYVRADGHISFFFLNPDGTEPTSEQVQRAQNVVDFSMPLEMQGHVYPINLSQVQYEIDLSYQPSADYAANLKAFSLNIRDRLFSILTPGAKFPSGYDPTVADVDSALTETFPADVRYSEPDIIAARAYNTPLGVNQTSVLNARVANFTTQQNVFSIHDLLTVGDPSLSTTDLAWPVVKAFTPYSSEKTAQLLYGNLRLEKILPWAPGTYTMGQVFRNPDVENSLLVVLRNFSFSDAALSPAVFILNGDISAPKDFVPWQVGNDYYANNQNTGFYDPDVILMDQELAPDGAPCDRLFFEPPGVDNLYYRENWYCFVVNADFTLQPSSDTVSGGQNQDIISDVSVSVPYLKAGGSYAAGSWIRTPTLGGGTNEEVDPYYYYIDTSLGVIVRYAYVNDDFTFLPSAGRSLAESFSQLIDNGTISSVSASNGLRPLPLFQYSPRFAPRTYLTYYETSGSNAEIYFTLTGFTPWTADPDEMVAAGVISRVDTNAALSQAFYEQTSQNPETGRSTVCGPEKMFVFSPGDTTLFRESGSVVSYLTTRHFSPVFTPGVYIRAGVLVPSELSGRQSIPFFSATGERPVEDIVISEDGKNVYRTMRYFTASSPVYNWDGEKVTATARLEELSGNLLRVVNKYSCEEQIKAPNGPDTSGIKLGIAQISLTQANLRGNTSTFVWENTDYTTQVPQLSFATASKEALQPVSYGQGTLAL